MDPLDIIQREVQGLKAGYKEIPSYRIKRFGYVDLQGEGILERLGLVLESKRSDLFGSCQQPNRSLRAWFEVWEGRGYSKNAQPLGYRYLEERNNSFSWSSFSVAKWSDVG